MDRADHGLLNIYEVNEGAQTRHLVCFLEPVRAGAAGIDTSAIVGEFTPTTDGGFDPRTFRLNEAFIDSFQGYMNHQAREAPELGRAAADRANGWLYIIDPRHHPEAEDDPAAEPPPSEVLGAFAVDQGGQIVADSFRYNRHHVWFDPRRGVSGVLADRRFYDWLHPGPAVGDRAGATPSIN